MFLRVVLVDASQPW